MRILFDQGTPLPLRRALAGHSVSTAYEMGWSQFSNGELLDAAEEAGFDLLITSDRNLPSQQNLANRKIAILALPTTSWPRLQKRTSEIVLAVNAIKPGEYREVTWN